MKSGLVTCLGSFWRTIAGVALLVAGGPSVGWAQYYGPCPCPQPMMAPGQAGPAMMPTQAAPGGPQSGMMGPPMPMAQGQPGPTDPNLFAQAGSAMPAAPETAMPGMIGDFFYASPSFFPSLPTVIPIPSPSAGVIGRDKIADNNNPLPQDRIFVDYAYFQNAILSTNVGVSRVTPGFEKTLFDGRMSLGMIFPFGESQAPTMDIAYSSTSRATQFGNMELTAKYIIYEADFGTITGGIQVTAPTAPNLNIQRFGLPFAKVNNQSVHMLPYLGLACEGAEWFSQWYVQTDFVDNGDEVVLNAGTAPATSVMVYDQTLLYADAMIGRWLYRDPCRGTGVAAVCEVHSTTALNNPGQLDLTSQGLGTVVLGTPGLSIFDATVGLHLAMGRWIITGAYCVPITTMRGFDSEARAIVSRYF